MCISINFKSKKALEEAVASGKAITVYVWAIQRKNGWGTVSGPHYPEPHKWYAQVEVKDGRIVKVK